MEQYKVIERSIIKKYRKEIWKRFISAVNDYELIQEGDKVAVCMSGGKDSTLMAKCMQELHRHGKIKFHLEFISMDPGYSKENNEKIERNARLLNIPIKTFKTDIYEIVSSIEDAPCYLCARMRRGYLYKRAQELGCNKIALGHHFDDAIETTLISMFYAGEYKTMMPKLHSSNFKGMELIRPMYKVREADVLAWARYNKLEFIKCACPLSEMCEDENADCSGSKRDEIKNMINQLRKKNANIDVNIFASLHNVNLETIIGWRKGGFKYSFLDEYNL